LYDFIPKSTVITTQKTVKLLSWPEPKGLVPTGEKDFSLVDLTPSRGALGHMKNKILFRA
jgi:hypothetical protein